MSDTNGTPRLSPHAAASATSPVAAPVVLVELDFASGEVAEAAACSDSRGVPLLSDITELPRGGW